MVRVVLGLGDGGIPVWELVEGPFMANAWSTRRLPPRGELWVDSGGYQALTRGARLSVEGLAARYRGLEASYYLSLDRPPRGPAEAGDPGLVRENYERFERLRGLTGLPIVPVVHPYPPRLLRRAVELYLPYRREAPLALGGAVPGLLNRGLKRVPTLILIALARRLWPGRLHVLGAGSPVMAAITGALGADSADTTSWRGKAAYCKVLVPGRGERYVCGRSIRYGPLHATPRDLEELEGFLRSTGFPMPPGGLRELLGSFQGRALVNAWVMRRSRWRPRRGGFTWLYRVAVHLARLEPCELEQLYDEAVERGWREALARRLPEALTRPSR